MNRSPHQSNAFSRFIRVKSTRRLSLVVAAVFFVALAVLVSGVVAQKSGPAPDPGAVHGQTETPQKNAPKVLEGQVKKGHTAILQQFTIELEENCSLDPLQTILADMLAAGELKQKPVRVGDQLRVIIAEPQRDLSAAPCVAEMRPGWQLLPDPKQADTALPAPEATESLASKNGSEQITGAESTGGVSGVVTAESSSLPLPDITVELYSYPGDPGASWTLVDFVETALDGSFFVGGLASGDYRVKFVDWLSGTYIAEFFDDVLDISLASDVSVTDGITTPDIDAALDLGGNITGTVTAEVGGALLENIQVCAYYDNGSYWQDAGCDLTNSSGGYDLGGLAGGSYWVSFNDTAGLYLAEYYNDAADIGSASDVSVSIGGTTANINAVLADSGHISGTVTAEDGGALLEGIQVQAYADNGASWENVSHATTDASGVYEINNLATGTYRVRFIHFDDQYMAEWHENAADVDSASGISVTAGSTTAGIDAALVEYGHISGTVTAVTGGSPLADIEVCVYHDDGSGWVQFDCVYTNAGGGYDIGGLAAGSYRVGFSENGGAYLDEYYSNALDIDDASNVSVSAGNTTANINAALADPGHITGTVTAEVGGALLEGIQVQVYRFNGFYWDKVGHAYSAANGSYDISGLITGTYRLRFMDIDGQYIAEWYENAADLINAADISVTAGSTTAGINVALMAYGHISGTVTAEDGGAHLYDVEVCAYFDYGSFWEHVACDYTDANGDYDISGLATGDYRIRFKDYDDNYALEFYDDVPDFDSAGAISVTVGSTTSGINSALAAAGYISGMVTADVGGASLAGIEACANYYNGSQWTSYRCADSNASGFYEIGGLPAGTYRVGFFDSSYNYSGEYYNDAADISSATNVSVSVGSTNPGINAALAGTTLPANDDFDSAAVIPAAPFDNNQQTEGATTAGDDPLPACGPGHQGYGSVWYAITPDHTVSLAVDTFGSSYDTVLSIWQGSRGSLTEVACNDDSGGPQSALTGILLGGGTTYYIEVAGYFNTLDALALNVDFITTAHDNALNAGWSMISSYVVAEDPAVSSILSTVVSDVELMKNGVGKVYWPAYGIDQIGSWDVRQGYQILMTGATNLNITGAAVNPAQMPVDLAAGWNMTAYLRDSAMPIDQALDTISQQVYLVKDDAGQVYWPAFDINEIGDMQPGEGYQIYMDSSGILTYPDN